MQAWHLAAGSEVSVDGATGGYLGEQVGVTYVYDESGVHLPPILNGVCSELRRRLEIGTEFNVIKFHTDQPKISFLSYPAFVTRNANKSS